MKFPKWYKDADASDRVRYLLAICVLNYKPRSTQADLVAQLGLSNTMAGHWIRSGTVAMGHAMEIEKLVGRDVMPWEVLANPMYDWDEK